MNSTNNIKNRIPSRAENPFKTPDGYFDTLHTRVMSSLKEEALKEGKSTSRILHFRPYVAIAASISGLALIVYIVMQSLLGSNQVSDDYYDLALIEASGILFDESVVAESYNSTVEDNYTDWEKGAMDFLASNEVDLIHLLATE